MQIRTRRRGRDPTRPDPDGRAGGRAGGRTCMMSDMCQMYERGVWNDPTPCAALPSKYLRAQRLQSTHAKRLGTRSRPLQKPARVSPVCAVVVVRVRVFVCELWLLCSWGWVAWGRCSSIAVGRSVRRHRRALLRRRRRMFGCTRCWHRRHTRRATDNTARAAQHCHTTQEHQGSRFERMNLRVLWYRSAVARRLE